MPFLTDYSDEASYTLPWDLLTQQTARDALQSARRLVRMAHTPQDMITTWCQRQSS